MAVCRQVAFMAQVLPESAIGEKAIDKKVARFMEPILPEASVKKKDLPALHLPSTKDEAYLGQSPSSEDFEASWDFEYKSALADVDVAMKNQNKKLRFEVARSCFGLVVLIFDIVGIAFQANESCDDHVSPSWSVWFIVHAVLVGWGFALTVGLVYASTMFRGLNVLSSQDRAQIKISEENTLKRELAEAVRLQVRKGKELATKIACALCFLILSTLVWVVVGFLLFSTSDIKECDDSKHWFIVVFGLGILLSAVSGRLLGKEDAC